MTLQLLPLAACALAYTRTLLMPPQYVATTLKISANLNFLQQIKDSYAEDKSGYEQTSQQKALKELERTRV